MSDLHARTVDVLQMAVDSLGNAFFQTNDHSFRADAAEIEVLLDEIADAASPVSKSQAKRVAALEADAQSETGIPITEQNQSVAQVAPLGPIERDEDFDRTYIPLPGGWEVQTKGKGSSFRICDTKDGERLLIPPSPYLHETLERMAKEIHAACTAPASQPADQYIGKDDVWTSPSAGGEDARDADSVRVAPEHPANTVRRALLRFAETTEDEGTTDLPSDVLTGLVAFGYLTRRRAGIHGYLYEITPAGDAIVTGQAAAAMKETK